MRNSSKVQSSYDNIFGYGKERDSKIKKEVFKVTASKATLPFNTVPGRATKVIPIPNREEMV